MADSNPAALFAAIEANDLERIRSLLDAHPEHADASNPEAFGTRPLIRAAELDLTAVVDLLLDLGVDPDTTSAWAPGPWRALDHAPESMVDHLLARGATLTPHAAARLGRIDDLRSILDDHPDRLHERGGDGATPLHFAGTAAVVDELLARGADPSLLDVDHASDAASWCAGNGRLDAARRLIERGATTDPFVLALAGDVERLDDCIRADPDLRRAVVDRSRYPGAVPHLFFFTIGEGCTLVHAAAIRGHAALIERLITLGADPAARGGYDESTPLHVAAWNDQPAAIDALVDGGADVDARSGRIHENEPIGWAIVAGAAEAIESLVRHGATVRPMHRTDVDAGRRGEFRRFRAVDPEVYDRIRETLDGIEHGRGPS